MFCFKILIFYSSINILTVYTLVNLPKIIVKDGNLIFESGTDRNITFRLFGNSRININDEYDLLEVLMQTKKGRISGIMEGNEEWIEEDQINLKQLANELDTLKTLIFGQSGIEKQLRTLQNHTNYANQVLLLYKTRIETAENRLKTIQERLKMDYCKSNPCQNGGTCLNIFGRFICKCTEQFEGPLCAVDVNECSLYTGTDLGCQNGGRCINQIGSYNCICQAGWYGLHCSQRVGDCMQSSAWELCGHGTCVNSNDTYGYKCICDNGWKTNGLTPACFVDVDECSESHTVCSTKCINLQGSFACAPCPTGLTGNGIHCRDIDECSTQNGGCSLNPKISCINTYGSYHCGECPLGWTGDGRTCTRLNSLITDDNSSVGGIMNCSTYNICHPQATCNEISNTIVCNCPAGMIGSGIGATGCIPGTSRNCLQQPCKNGGTCLDNGSSYVCVCLPGYNQPNCTAEMNPCVPNPCRNNGRCILQNATQLRCECSAGFTGNRCEKRFNRCGGILYGLTGRLMYPMESFYEHNSQCAWIIRTNESLVLNVTFNKFDLEDSTECRFDWLQINDGRTAADQLIGRFCGSHKPRNGNIISTTNNLYLWFRTDNSTAREGFDLEWNSILPQCGGVIFIVTHGTIATPGSPGNYPKNRDCLWQLKAPYNKRIKLTFFALNIEQHDSCNYDYVEIIDAISKETKEKYCHSMHPEPLLLSSNEINIHFHSDDIGTDAGFQIYYFTEDAIPYCGGTYTEEEGEIFSPVVIQDYISCEYEIRLPTSETATIEFRKFKMGEDDCLEFYDIPSYVADNILQAKYCGGYHIMPPTLHSTFNRFLIKFYAKPGAEFALKYKSDCVHTFESDEGTIYSPNYPTVIGIERYCIYKIITKPDTTITLYIEHFDLVDNSLDNTDCATTALIINYDLLENSRKVYCNEKTPLQDIVSKTNMIELYYRSGIGAKGHGFKINYKAIPMRSGSCGGVYTKSNYTIRSPNDEAGFYMHNLQCYWIIIAPVHQSILIDWKLFKLENSIDCKYDYIEIYDNLANSNSSKQPLGKFCKAYPPTVFMSHSHILTIKFVTDAFDNDEGFEFVYSFIDGSSQCGGTIYSSTGTIRTPNWPLNYMNNLDCIWILHSPAGTQMELEITIFDVEQSTNCNKDWLEIRNGASKRSNLVGRFCGNYTTNTIPKKIPSFTNQMLLHFHTDNIGTSSGFQLGWHIFSNGCGGNIYSREGVITSPYYPNHYPNDAECDWRIHVSSGSIIEFVVEDLDLESTINCRYDALEIFDGNPFSGDHLAMLCENPNNKTLKYTTTSNYAAIRFRTDSTYRGRGFLLTYHSNCSSILTNIFGIIESPNFGFTANRYDEDINCAWTIKASKGNRIHLEFSYFASLDGNAFLAIQDGNVTYQIREMDRVFNSSTDTIVLRQTSKSLIFQLEYVMIGCIQNFRSNSDSFETPNYPKPYANNLECLWQIMARPGQIIDLNIYNMDIEESVNCVKDALIITSHPKNAHTKERHCGRSQHFSVSSSGHKLYIKFISDGDGNGKGFTASYTTKENQCGGVLSGKNGIITSPNYPNNYPANSDCEWIVQVSPHHSIVLTLEELDMEEFFNCAMDYLEATEEIYHNSSIIKLFKKCGTLDINTNNTWRSLTNSVVLQFHSDKSVFGKGFKLSYQEECGMHLQLDNSTAREISFVKYASNGEICRWQFESKDFSKHIILSITHVHLNPLWSKSYRNEEYCKEEGAKVYEGIGTNGPIREKFCKIHPPDIISNGYSLTLTIPLNVISEFEATATIMDSYCGAYYSRSLSGKFSSPYYPSAYFPNLMCFWTIEPSKGNTIILTFEDMDLEESDGCNNDYVEVRQTNNDRLLGVFCGKQNVASLNAMSELTIRFNSDNNQNVGSGFLASYAYALHSEINGTQGVIESPAYPIIFHTEEPYSWRITVDNEHLILLTITDLSDVNIPYVKFYDGYSDIGVPLDYSNSHIVQTYTSMLYLTAMRGPFQFEWQQISKESVRENRTAEKLANICGSQLIRINSSILFHSPGYPMGYENNLNCSWTLMPTNQLTHVELSFVDIDLDTYFECSDYIEIFASSDLQNWQNLGKLCKKPTNNTTTFKGTPYLKLHFATNSFINKTGFTSLLTTKCGSHLTDSSMFVNITPLIAPHTYAMECIWYISVRQGRRIRLKFLESVLQRDNSSANCNTYFLVKNGQTEDSPFLGKGKYCNNNITDILETSSNHAYIKLYRMNFPKFKASFYYEEITYGCSEDIRLIEGPDLNVRSISSPNYPNLPNPHSECIWKILAPIHETISVHFVGDYNIANGSAFNLCDREYIQINDGLTQNAPVLGRFCGSNKPNTVYATTNRLRIAYYTDLSEPHKGFRANVAITRCGGYFYEPEGSIKSPNDLKFPSNETEMQCLYTVEVTPGSLISVSVDNLHLPENDDCSKVTHLEFQEIDAYGSGGDYITDKLVLCGEAVSSRFIVETNKLVIVMRVMDHWNSDDKFQINYSTVGSGCGEKTISFSNGLLQTPNYPIGLTTPTQCYWYLEVAKGRRIKIEFLDFDIGTGTSSLSAPYTKSFSVGSEFRGSLIFANDYAMKSIITKVSRDPPNVIYSTDNTMGIDVLLFPHGKNKGVKLRYSSDEESLYCRQQLPFNTTGQINTFNFIRDKNISIYCNYEIAAKYNHTFVLRVTQYERYKTTPAWTIVDCNIMSPLEIRLKKYRLLPYFLCNNVSQLTVRLPFPAHMILSGNNRNALKSLQLQYERFNCGGVWTMYYYDEFVINEPQMGQHRGRLECAWAVWGMYEADTDHPPDFDEAMQYIQMDVQISTDFKGNCDDEYLIVYNGPNQNFPHLGRYCQQTTLQSIVVDAGLFFEFITKNYNMQSKFNITIHEGSGCGGKLTYPYRQVVFDYQYKNNVECIWEVTTISGFHLSVQFAGRFFIEHSTNCYKDYLRIQHRASGEEEWSDLITLCGREPPNYVNSTYPEMRLIFRSDNDTTGTGFTMNFARNCGGEFPISNSMQQIASPGYPEPGYPSKLHCNYTILPSKDVHYDRGDNLYVRFIKFEVEDTSIISCLYDKVTIYAIDSYGVETKTVLCGRKTDYVVRANRSISIVLETDGFFSSKGFLLEYGPNKCDVTITQSTFLTSPRDFSTNTYPHNSKCIWYLKAPENHKIILKFKELEFESQAACNFDGLDIYKGLIAKDEQRIAKFCGNLTDRITYVSIPQNTGMLVSYSDYQDASKGFKVMITFIKNCDKNLYLDIQNSSYTLNIYGRNYPNMTDCSWVFTTLRGYQLQIEFREFAIKDSRECNQDYVELRDGSTLLADTMGRFCGNDLPSTVVSSNRAVLIRFVSSVLNVNNSLTLTIKAIPMLCGQHNYNLDNNLTALIKSPDAGSGKYPNNINCLWILRSSSTIHISFEKFDLESVDVNGACTKDYLKIINSDDVNTMDGGGDSSLILAGANPMLYSDQSGAAYATEYIYCGNHTPNDYFSGSKVVFVKFSSNENITRNGFLMKATATNGCYRNFTGIQGRIKLMQNVDECDIYIRSPANHTLSLYYQDAIFSEFDCDKEYIEVFDIASNTSLQKNCNYMDVGRALFTTVNALRIHIKLNGYFSHILITYVASTNGTGCGGDLYNTGGTLTNPFYPQNKRENAICRWNIRVPPNLQVLLKFPVFNLGAKSTCHTDYLQIIEYTAHGLEKVMRQFCGEDEPEFYRSQSNYVVVSFHKTVNYDGTGWVMTFDGVHKDSKIV